MMLPRTAVALALVPSLAAGQGAVVQEFHDPPSWEAAVGTFSTIGFVGIPDEEDLSDQFAGQGVLFPDGTDRILTSLAFKKDGVGVKGDGIVTVSFAGPQVAVAADHPGLIQIDLYSGGTHVATAGPFGAALTGHFAGVISDTPFDRVEFSDPFDQKAFIDDLHWGDAPDPLEVDLTELSIANGGAQAFSLHAGAERAGDTYLLMGSVSGTAPGVPLGGGHTLPLAFDAYTLSSLDQPNAPPLAGSLGVLDAGGEASASFTLPLGLSPALVGTSVHHAYVVVSTGAPVPSVVLVSNAVALGLIE